MFDPIPIAVDQLLRFREADAATLTRFQGLMHNDDLCPRAERQLNQVLDCFDKYQQIAYDVQGFRDRGTDVVLRYNPTGETMGDSPKYIGLQLKSFDDIQKDGYLATLKTQLFDAQTEFAEHFEQYFIVLCTDPELHRDKIREIKKYFSTRTDVTIVDPAFAYTFLGLSRDRVTMIVDAILRVGDTVERQANEDVANLTPTEAALLVTAAYFDVIGSSDLSIESFRDNAFVRAIYNRIPGYPRDYYFYVEGTLKDEFEDEEDEEPWYWDEEFSSPPEPTLGYSDERLVADLEQMPFYQGASRIEFDGSAARPIKALLLDAAVRYGFAENQLLEHVFGRLRVTSRFLFEDLDDELTATT